MNFTIIIHYYNQRQLKYFDCCHGFELDVEEIIEFGGVTSIAFIQMSIERQQNKYHVIRILNIEAYNTCT